MICRIAADLIFCLHLIFIIFVVAGGLLVYKWKWVLWFHLPAAVWGIMIEFFGWICPLTPLEDRLRLAAGEQGLSGGFIAEYLVPIVYPSGLNPTIQIILGSFVIFINIIIYGLWLRQRIK